MPRRKTGIIIRKSLMDKMTDLSSEHILFIKAPGGYGKSIAARQWLEQYNNYALIQLDEHDNNIEKLCRKLANAVKMLDKSNTMQEELLKHSQFSSAPEEFFWRIMDNITPSITGAIVIDDLYLIHNKDCIKLIGNLCNKMPIGVAITICSRENLPELLEYLYLQGDLIELNSDLLSFDVCEVKSLYTRHGVDITNENAKKIVEQSGGWILGLKALLMSDEKDKIIKIPMIDNFLRNHVWPFWSEEQRSFMLKTCVADRFTAELCEALTKQENCTDFLETLSRSNSFISQIRDGIYQYHHIFRDFLFELASEDEHFLQNQYSLLGKYYMERMDIYNAVTAFHKSGDENRTAQTLITGYTQMNRNSFRIDSLVQIIELGVSDSLASKFPFLYFLKTWSALCQGQPDNFSKYADLYYSNYDKLLATTPELGHTKARMFIMDYRTPIKESSALFTAYNPNHSLQKSGAFTMDSPLFHRGYRDFSEIAEGDVIENMEMLRPIVQAHLGAETDILVNMMIAGLLYEQGNLETALKYTLSFFTEYSSDMVPSTRFSIIGITFYIYQAIGNTEMADKILTMAEEKAEKNKDYYLNPSLKSMRMIRAFYSGDTESAKKWLENYHISPGEPLNLYKSWLYINSARALLLLEDYDAAIILLSRIVELATKLNRPLDIIECCILLSIAYWQKPSTQSIALECLEHAISIASKYNFIQLFINDCGDILAMLQRLINRMEQKDKATAKLHFSRRLLSEIKISGNIERSLIAKNKKKNVSLTKRQTEIMQIISQGNNFAETAEKLGITRYTVRSHMELIYKKLGVTSLEGAIKEFRSIK